MAKSYPKGASPESKEELDRLHRSATANFVTANVLRVVGAGIIVTGLVFGAENIQKHEPFGADTALMELSGLALAGVGQAFSRFGRNADNEAMRLTTRLERAWAIDHPPASAPDSSGFRGRALYVVGSETEGTTDLPGQNTRDTGGQTPSAAAQQESAGNTGNVLPFTGQTNRPPTPPQPDGPGSPPEPPTAS